MSTVKTIAGQLDAKGLKVAVVATRFNDFIVDRLVGGALDYLERHGLNMENVTMVRIPGAFEMPLVCQKLAASGKYDGFHLAITFVHQRRNLFRNQPHQKNHHRTGVQQRAHIGKPSFMPPGPAIPTAAHEKHGQSHWCENFQR